MKVYFLEARLALTKVFTQLADGSIAKEPYPHAADFKSHVHQITSPLSFERELVHHAARGHCLLKGLLKKDLNFESRAGSTSADDTTEFLVLDIDGMLQHTIEEILHKLEIKDTSYIIQYSASQGITNSNTLSCHIFILLTKPIAAPLIKQWLIRKNLDNFPGQIRLTRSGVALHYPLDITACQNDKLIYIAPPKCYPPEINKFEGERIELIQKERERFDFPDFEHDHINRDVQNLINQFRKLHGLPKRPKYEEKFDGAQIYLPNPDKATVTGEKDGRGFTYLNIDGGNSWGYWYPEDNFEFIHNFKGEPIYKTSEFLPEYYAKKRQALLPVIPKEVSHHIFRDPRADTYYNGWYNSNTKAHEFLLTGNKQKLVDYMGQYGLKAPKEIPDWMCIFDPQSKIQVDPAAKYWNRFTPSKYMDRPQSETTTVPPTILAVLCHVLGATANSPVLTALLNWLAFAFQYRRAAGTAWMLQGIPGTGKGLLVNHILKPLFGATNFTARRMEELEDKFNGYLEGCLICYIDEVHIGVSKRSDMIMANLKNQITEPSITIRNMRQTAYEVPNYLNWIMSSNMSAPIQLDREDRRFNVGGYQTQPIRVLFPDTASLVAQLEIELVGFADFLTQFKVDLASVRIPIQNEARQDLIDASLTSLDVVGAAVLSGDLETLASYISTELEINAEIRSDRYKVLIQEFARTGRNKITRDELRTIFLHTVGDGVPATPAKFTRFLNHRGIKLKKVRVGDKTIAGIEVEWQLNNELIQEILTGVSVPYLKVVNDGLSGVQ